MHKLLKIIDTNTKNIAKTVRVQLIRHFNMRNRKEAEIAGEFEEPDAILAVNTEEALLRKF